MQTRLALPHNALGTRFKHIDVWLLLGFSTDDRGRSSSRWAIPQPVSKLQPSQASVTCTLFPFAGTSDILETLLSLPTYTRVSYDSLNIELFSESQGRALLHSWQDKGTYHIP